VGSTITEDGKNREDIMRRIREAKVMFNNKNDYYYPQITLVWKLKNTYKELYLECCCLWIRNMDPRKNEDRVLNTFETWS
jgi:hypothetical protein